MKTLKTPQDAFDRVDTESSGLPSRFKASWAVFKALLSGVRTANAAEPQLLPLFTPNAPDVSAVPDGGWFVVAPYGEHASPDGTYTQVFGREQADRVVKTWNSIPGAAMRWFKNLSHGLGGKFSMPVWDGHPDDDKARWPVERLLGEMTGLRATANGLEGKQTWNANGCAKRTQGQLYPSPLWWHWPKDAQGRVFPELLESIGLVPTPNISGVPAWTQNAQPDPATAEVLNPTATPNAEEEAMKKIALKLGLPETATEEEITAKLATMMSTANAGQKSIVAKLGLAEEATAEEIAAKVAEVLTTANAAATRQTELTTANGRITALEGEKTTLTTANTELTGIVGELAGGVVHGFELAGVIPPSDREAMKGKLTANATAKAAVADLIKKKPVMNVQSITLGADKRDISTANARRQVIDDAVKKRMKDTGEGYDLAYANVQGDPSLKGVFEAMADPTKSTAA